MQATSPTCRATCASWHHRAQRWACLSSSHQKGHHSWWVFNRFIFLFWCLCCCILSYNLGEFPMESRNCGDTFGSVIIRKMICWSCDWRLLVPILERRGPRTEEPTFVSSLNCDWYVTMFLFFQSLAPINELGEMIFNSVVKYVQWTQLGVWMSKC